MPEFDSTVEYRDIAECPGYKVGSDGTVWTGWKIKGNGQGKSPTHYYGHPYRMMSTKAGRADGYHAIQITRGRLRYVHRLVLEAFVGPCPEGMEACHNDGDPSNNALSNLRWDTRSSNTKDQVKHGRHHGWSYVNGHA